MLIYIIYYCTETRGDRISYTLRNNTCQKKTTKKYVYMDIKRMRGEEIKIISSIRSNGDLLILIRKKFYRLCDIEDTWRFCNIHKKIKIKMNICIHNREYDFACTLYIYTCIYLKNSNSCLFSALARFP